MSNQQQKKQSENNQKKNHQPLWLCLYFFELPFNVIPANANSNDIVVIIEKNSVVFASPLAIDAGIKVGMRLATVYAIAPAATAHERDTSAEADILENLAHWCYQFTPSVSLEKNFCLNLEISGSLKLFHGLKALLTLIEDSLKQQGYTLRYGFGHSPLTAWLFSQYEHPLINLEDLCNSGAIETKFFINALRKIPLTYLDLPEKQLKKLLNLGLSHIDDLLNLPTASLGKRYGKDFIQLIKAIKGEDITLFEDWTSPTSFEQYVDFSNGLTKTNELREPIKALLSSFSQFLLAHHYHPQSFCWRFLYFKETSDVLEINLASNDHSFHHLLATTCLQLEKFKIKAPIESLKLDCSKLIKSTQSSGDLFPELSQPDVQLNNYCLLLDKLYNRLGNQALHCLVKNDEHLPEKKQSTLRLTPRNMNKITIPLPSPHKSTSTSTLDPLWLLSNPVAIKNTHQGLYYQGLLEITYRLQRIDNHWWKQRQQRDYFIAKSLNGVHYWLFKDLTTEKWFVHGVFG